MNLENTFLIKNLTKNTLNIGTSKIIPIKSVKNPGISKNTPQINKTILLIFRGKTTFDVNIWQTCYTFFFRSVGKKVKSELDIMIYF